MRAAAEARPLVNLAQSRAPGDRERLLAKLADLCESRARPFPTSAAGEVEAVLLALVDEADSDVRARFAERVARAAWPPARLIERLARDDIEVARPLLAASPALGEEALIALAEQAGPAHRWEIAHRPLLSARVAAALVERTEPELLLALAANRTAALDHEIMRRLIGRVAAVPGLAALLALHPRFDAEDAAALAASLGPADREGLVRRFHLDPLALPDEVAGPSAGTGGPDASEVRLVEKLAAAGQLRGATLVRVLKEGRVGLFEAALAKLGGFEPDQVRRAVEDPERPELLALALASVGLDRSIFPTVLQLVRRRTGGLPGGGEESARRAASAFEPFSPEQAAAAFRLALGGV